MQTNHYYSEVQDSISKIKKISVKLKEASFEIYASGGVFSKNRLDKGTEVLINNCIVKDKWKVLDFGCGYGVVGVAVKKLYPQTEVVMTDINKRAVKLTRMNIKLHKLEIKLKQGNLYEKVDNDFDTILVNPPQTAGKEICFDIISEAKKHLKRNGILQVVVRPKKGGKQLSEFMKETFGNLDVAAKKSGYSIYVSKNG